MNTEIQISRFVRRVAEYLTNVGAEGEAKRFTSIRIQEREGYACVFRTLTNVDSALRVRWAAEGLRGSRLGTTVEILGLLRLATQASLNGRDDCGEWIETLQRRMDSISGSRRPSADEDSVGSKV